MSFSINTGEIKAAVFPTGVTKTPKPDPGEYEATDAGTLLCTFGFRSYIKTNAGLAYVAWFQYTDVYIGPILVSETQTAVSYSADGFVFDNNQSFSYMGKTWYYSKTEFFMPAPGTNAGGMAQYIGEFGTAEAAARHLLDLVYGT